MKSAQIEKDQTRFSPLKIGILVLALVTLAVHLIVLNIQLQLGRPDFLFTLNGLGYLSLLILYFLPVPIAQSSHNLIRWVFILYTAVTILAWFFIGERSILGYFTKLDELGLIALLWLDKSQ